MKKDPFLRRDHGPADTSSLDSWPADLDESKFLLLQATQCGPLLRLLDRKSVV